MSISYDEFVSELAVSIGEEALARLGPEAARSALAVVSAATVSAHWLLSDDSGVELPHGAGLGAVLRGRYEAGDRVDRDAMEWILGICSLLFLLAYLPEEFEETLQSLAAATQLGDALIESARELAELSTGRVVAMGQGSTGNAIRRADELIMEGCGVEGIETDSLKLTVMLERFQDFFAAL